jgi:hypothetical protein
VGAPAVRIAYSPVGGHTIIAVLEVRFGAHQKPLLHISITTI